MLPIPLNINSLLSANTFRFATLWKIKRTDYVTFNFTNHDSAIVYLGDTYTPAAGLDSTAKQAQAGLRDNNVEYKGILDSSAITHDDLIAGKYRDAQITETLIDWRYPWAGAFEVKTYWVVSITFSDAVWNASIAGLTRWLNPNVGKFYNRNCRHILGDPGCTININVLTQSGSVTSTVDPRQSFIVSGLTAIDSTYFNHGMVLWTSGANGGLTSEIMSYDGGTGLLKLWLKLPYNVVATDTFTAYPGCDKTYATCVSRYNNIVNFGGFPFVPGNDQMLATPAI